MTQTVATDEGKAYSSSLSNARTLRAWAFMSQNQPVEALEPVRQGLKRCFGAIAPEIASGLKLRHDGRLNKRSRLSQNRAAVRH